MKLLKLASLIKVLKLKFKGVVQTDLLQRRAEKLFLKISLRKSSYVITVPTKWEIAAFQTRILAPPGEQSTESERSQITFKTQRSMKEV